MFRFALLAVTLGASPALASHYQAQPAARPAQAKIISSGTVWTCGDAGCAAGKANSRPAIVCAALVKEIGAVSSFSVAGQALSGDDLQKCNARAR